MPRTDRKARTPRVIITGAAGYIGSHVTLAFLEREWHVTAVDDLSAGARSAVPNEVEFIEMDCGSPALAHIMATSQFDVAVHLAAKLSVEESIADPLGYYEANICTARRFLGSVLSARVPAFLFSSTAAVYGEAAQAVRETDVCAPLSPYGRSKLAAEWLLRDVSAATRLRHVILRYFNVAGADPAGRAGPRVHSKHLIKIACEAAVGLRSEVLINGANYDTPDGTCVRDYIHVSDVAEAHAAAAEYLLGIGDCFTANCGYGWGFSVREVLDAALAEADVPFYVRIGERRPGDAAIVIANADLITERLNWRPMHSSLKDILKTGMAWERSRRVQTDDHAG
jgi:UDP-glucose 4-epimerase